MSIFNLLNQMTQIYKWKCWAIWRFLKILLSVEFFGGWVSQSEKWNFFSSVLWTWNLTFHWLFSTNPVEDRARFRICMTFGSMFYRIGGEMSMKRMTFGSIFCRIGGELSMKCQISCPQDRWEICFSPCVSSCHLLVLKNWHPSIQCIRKTEGRNSVWPCFIVKPAKCPAVY